MQEKNSLRIIYVLIAIIVVETIFLALSCQRRLPRTLPKPKAALERRKKAAEHITGKVAIVLDDWGYNLNNLGPLEKIKEPLTLAILPNLNYSAKIARKARELGDEVILHLPLEPYEHYRLEANTILVDMQEVRVLKILTDDLKSVPGAVGISNHMGSKATENSELMSLIFSELKKRKLYFLDSFTSRTICKDLAVSMGVPYARRYVFLDNKNDSAYILSQIETLARIAVLQGAAVGIGHCRQKTLEVLVQEIPELKKRGLKFVYVSELVK